MLSLIAQKFGSLVTSTWMNEVEQHARLVYLYRRYVTGDHRAEMTPEMKEMLRISGNVDDQFNINLCDMVVASMADRLSVSGIVASMDDEAASDRATEWADEILRRNRFDGLQMDIHSAALMDGVTYAMLAWDNDRQIPVIEHELAYDGYEGLIPVYDRKRKHIVAAAKVWKEGDLDRVNLYYPDRVEKYRYQTAEAQPVNGQPASALGELETSWWTKDGSETGEPIGMTIIPFFNKRRPRMTTGISEVAAVIPMQDALNRTLVSMVMTAELSAFQLRVAIGFEPPAKVTPGMWIIISGKNPISREQVVDAKVLEQAQIVPFINQAQFLIEQIATVSRTPFPGNMGGDNQSGEALKQREVQLLGKVKQFHTRAGNAWEDVLTTAARLQNIFGNSAAPEDAAWNTQWNPAEIRNDTATIDNAIKVRGEVGHHEFLRMIAPVYGWDEAKINELLAEVDQERASALAALPLPGFAQFQLGAGLPDEEVAPEALETEPA